MQRAATTPGLDSGAQLEIRVAQAWFWDGYYVRRGVDLQHRFGSDVSTVTDLDILAYSFDQSLMFHTFIGEVKSGKSNNTPRPLDRAIWARGLRELMKAESAEVTTAFRPSISVREFAAQLGVTIQHVDDLSVRESRLSIDKVSDVGSQGDSVARQIVQIGKHVRNEPELERAFWFLRSEVWFLDAFDALKRTLGLLRQLHSRWPTEADDEGMRTARWMYAEAISIIALQLTKVAGIANRMDTKTFIEYASDKLSAGDIPTHTMRHLADRIDEYVGKLLSTTDLPAEVKVEAMGAFTPTPPSYLEPLLELVVRLAVNASATARLPRQVDAIVFERLVRRRNFSETVQQRLLLEPASERLVRLLAAFMRGQVQLPLPVDKVLTAPLRVEHLPASDQHMLFSS